MDESILPGAPPATRCVITRSYDGWTIDVSSPDVFDRALQTMREMATLPMPMPAAVPGRSGRVSESSTTLAPTSQGSMLTLGQSMRDYLGYLPSTTKLNHKGQVECRASLELFLGLVGDRPVATLTRDLCKEFVRKLQLWPAHSSKKAAFRDLPDAAAVLKKAKETGAECISPVTVRNRVGYVYAWTRYLQSSNTLTFDPFHGVMLPSAKRQLDRRPPTPDELAVMFDAENRKALVSPYMWWAPVLALYTGARVREIGQLYLDDIDCIQDVPVIHINDRFKNQQLKTEASRRVVPIHPELERLGFLDYVREMRAKNQKLLFPGLPWLGGKDIMDPGRKIGRSFKESYLKVTCKIDDPALTFHSFRHHFATQANRADMEDARIARLTGHKLERENALGTNYIQARTLRERYEDLQSIELPCFPLDPYVPRQFAAWFRESKKTLTPRPCNLPARRAGVLDVVDEADRVEAASG